MVFSMSSPEACGESGGGVAARSCLRKNPATSQIFNVLATALCLLSGAPVASAGIFPYDNMELQVR